MQQSPLRVVCNRETVHSRTGGERKYGQNVDFVPDPENRGREQFRRIDTGGNVGRGYRGRERRRCLF